MGTSTARRVTSSSVLVVLGVAAALASLVAGATPVAAAEACGGTTPTGSVRVAVVVDDGTSAPSSRCFTLSEGATGADLLRQRADALGLARPRYAPSGLLCAIDGFPAPPACGDLVAGSYRYWAYFQGTGGSWVYGSSVNPFTRRLRDGDIEGWRFTTRGTATGSNEVPRLAPDRSSLFPAAPPVTAPAPSTPPAPAPAPADGTAGVDGSPIVPPATGDPSVSTTTAPDAAVAVPSGPDGDGTAAPAASVAGGDRLAGGGDQVAAEVLDPEPASSSRDLLGPVLGIVVVAAVAGAAALRFREGSRP